MSSSPIPTAISAPYTATEQNDSATKVDRLPVNFFSDIFDLGINIMRINTQKKIPISNREIQLYQNIFTRALTYIPHADLQELLDLRRAIDIAGSNQDIAAIAQIDTQQQILLKKINALILPLTFPELKASTPIRLYTWVEDNSTGHKVIHVPYCTFLVQGKMHVMLYDASTPSAVQNSTFKVVIAHSAVQNGTSEDEPESYESDFPLTINDLNHPVFGIDPNNFSAKFAVVALPIFKNRNPIAVKMVTYYTKI